MRQELKELVKEKKTITLSQLVLLIDKQSDQTVHSAVCFLVNY